MPKRSGKFYRKNEAEVMRSLGLKPTKNSGSGWIEKEDGQNEHLICQLKSTDANSIRIQKLDLDKLNYNAEVANKIPIFAIQFLQSNEVYLLVSPENLLEVRGMILDDKSYKSKREFLGLCSGQLVETNIGDSDNIDSGDNRDNTIPKVKSSYKSRKAFESENDKKYKKQSKKAT